MDQSDDQLICCKLCDKKYKSKKSLNRHMFSHSSNKYICNVCNAVFSHPRLLKVHENLHKEGGKLVD